METKEIKEEIYIYGYYSDNKLVYTGITSNIIEVFEGHDDLHDKYDFLCLEMFDIVDKKEFESGNYKLPKGGDKIK